MEMEKRQVDQQHTWRTETAEEVESEGPISSCPLSWLGPSTWPISIQDKGQDETTLKPGQS